MLHTNMPRHNTEDDNR